MYIKILCTHTVISFNDRLADVKTAISGFYASYSRRSFCYKSKMTFFLLLDAILVNIIMCDYSI